MSNESQTPLKAKGITKAINQMRSADPNGDEYAVLVMPNGDFIALPVSNYFHLTVDQMFQELRKKLGKNTPA